jgi:hypothetical protein
MSSEPRRTRARLGLAMLALSVLACADLERGPAPPVPEAGPDVAAGDGGGISFATVRPLLDDGCRSCHAAGQQAGDTGLLLNGDAVAEYTAVRPFVDPGAPAGSRLLAKASGQGHGGGTIYRAGSPEYAALLAWIESGAGP